MLLFSYEKLQGVDPKSDQEKSLQFSNASTRRNAWFAGHQFQVSSFPFSFGELRRETSRCRSTALSFSSIDDGWRVNVDNTTRLSSFLVASSMWWAEQLWRPSNQLRPTIRCPMPLSLTTPQTLVPNPTPTDGGPGNIDIWTNYWNTLKSNISQEGFMRTDILVLW